MSRALACLLLAPVLALPRPVAAEAGPPEEAATVTQPPSWADREVTRLAELLSRDIAEPGALHHLVALRELIPEAVDLPALRDAFLRAAWTRRAHGEVKAYARWCIAQVEWRRGRRPKAARWVRTLGTMTEGAFVGPFDNEGGTGFDRVYPPETAELQGALPDPDATFPGKERPVRWRSLPDAFPLGFVDLGPFVEPADEVVVYVRMVVESDRTQQGAIRLGAPGAVRMWQEGRLVHSDPHDHPPRFDQAAVPVLLQEGPNRFLLKLTQKRGLLGFYFRVSDPDGDRLRGVRTLDPFTDHPRPHRTRRERRGEPRVPPQVDTVLARLRERVEAAPEDALARGDLAVALDARRAFEQSERLHLVEAQAALELADDDGVAARAALRVAAYDDDDNNQRLALERALRLDPTLVPARTALATSQLDRGATREAIENLRSVVRAEPGHLEAELRLADAEGLAGFPEMERARIRSLLEQYPLAPQVLRAAARLERAKGRLDLAERHLRVAVALYPGDDSLRSSLTSVLLQRGDLDGVVIQLGHEAAFAPSALYPRLRLADLLSANGRPRAAEDVYSELVVLAPDSARIHLRRARHHLRHGSRVAALADLDRARALTPQDPQIAELRRHLTEDEDDFARAYERRLEDVIAANGGEAPTGADVWTLFDLTAVEVHPNGLASRVHQQIHRAVTPRGADELRSFSLPYTPGDQELRLDQARVMKKDGTILVAREESERSLSEPWYRLYYDRRARIVSFPELEPGDTVELLWRLDDVAAVNMLGDYFGDLTFLQDTDPTRERQYVLVGPPGRRFYFNEVKLEGLEHRVEALEDGRQVLRWSVENTPGLVPEPGMPGWSEVAPYLHVSTYEKWEDVAVWWWGLISEQLVATTELRELAGSLVEGIAGNDVAGRVRAIHNYVVRATRYVGLEFGIHGYKPYRVDLVHNRRFGDCKDKASLMYSLLDAIGIHSRMVILRMNDLGRIPAYPASLAVFNHAILHVPELDWWLDGTAEFAGTAELPAVDRGAAVLVVDPEDPSRSRFGYVPEPAPDANLSETRLTFRLSPDGSASANGHFVVRGAAAPGYREAYQAEDRRRRLFESSWGSTFPGARVTRLEMAGLDELEEPVTADFDIDVPRLAESAGGREVTIAPFGEGRGYAERYAPLSTRRHDLVLRFPFTGRFEYRIELPDGWKVRELPEPVQLESQHGSFTLVYEQGEASVSVRARITLSRRRIETASYDEFRSFLADVDRAQDRRIRIDRPAERASR